jgi:phosphoglycerol transferase MdoB-like AlkP superfamily enzyme
VRTGQVSRDQVSTALTYAYYGKRSGDLYVIQEPYYLFSATGTSHGTPFDYDSHVPVIFMGAGIKPGHYYEKIAVNDIAPTLAAIAGVQEPSGSIGRVLQEMWQ